MSEDTEGVDAYNKLIDEILTIQENSTGPFPVVIQAVPDAVLPKASGALMALVFLCEEVGFDHQQTRDVLSRVLQRFAYYVLSQTADVLTKDERVSKVVTLPDANFISWREEEYNVEKRN